MSENGLPAGEYSVRSVSGYGPRCGCGGESTLHVRRGRWPLLGTFLCGECVLKALNAFLLARPSQPSFWPGDEERDEPYEPPAPVEVERVSPAPRATGGER